MKNIPVIVMIAYCTLMNAGETPEIAVDGNAKVDFGTYPAKERKEAFYKIVNKGDAVLKIGKIRKTCGCAEAKIDKKEIKPKVNIYAGHIPAEKKWQQEFLLEAAKPGVKLGEPILQSNTQARAVLAKKSGKLFHLVVSITPEKGKIAFKCKVKIPVINPKGWKAPEILIMGKIVKLSNP